MESLEKSDGSQDFRIVTVFLSGVVQLKDLSGKRVLITGGANGIGKSMVEAFDEAGAMVSFCDMNSSQGIALEEATECAKFTLLDLRIEDQVRQWIDQSAEINGRIDVLINNAASDPRIEFESMTVEQWDDLFARNIRAYFIAAQQASTRFPATGGAMINFSSITVHKSPAKMEAYVSTKAATIGLTQSLARELGPRNIRVNTLSPGWVMTDRQLEEFVTPEVKQMLRREQCIGELILPGEIAKVALFLASEMSSAITGQEFLVDRGWACSG